jgi:hypothetical protein
LPLYYKLEKNMADRVEFEDIVNFFREQGWQFGLGERNSIRLAFEGNNGEYNALLLYPWEKELIVMYVEYAFKVPESRGQDILNLVARINWGLLFGVCEYHPDKGIVRFRANMLTDDAPFNIGQFSTMVATTLSTADRYAPAFDAVLKDRLMVTEALELVESPPAPL